MELEETQFIKNRGNDVFNRGTIGEWLSLQIIRLFLIVGIYDLLRRLITEPKNLEYWYGLNDKDFDPPVELSVEDISYDRKELVVYDKYDRSEVNTTMYEIVEIEVE